MKKTILYIAFFFVYFHISGLSTTNILRLTRGNSRPVLDSKCCCDKCGYVIPPILQLPIVSYIACKGKCKNCGVRIPEFPLQLELIVLMGMFVITVLMQCSFCAVGFSFLFYELIRIVVVIVLGKRAEQFAKQYVIAVLAMVPFYVLTLFVALIYSLI